MPTSLSRSGRRLRGLNPGSLPRFRASWRRLRSTLGTSIRKIYKTSSNYSNRNCRPSWEAMRFRSNHNKTMMKANTKTKRSRFQALRPMNQVRNRNPSRTTRMTNNKSATKATPKMQNS
jgi:hypothetical protein